ncbi:MAG: copper chaperone PCu(A)C [Rhodospirillales bacterium]
MTNRTFVRGILPLAAFALLSFPAAVQAHDIKSHGAMEKPAAAEQGIAVSGAWARPTIAKMRISAAYFQASLAGDGEDKLIGVKADIAARAELHEHVMEGTIARMRPVSEVALSAGSPVVFKPGGYHVMLFDLKQALQEGETFSMTLVFQKAGDVPVTVQVMKKAGGHGGHGHHGGHKH